MYLLHNLIYDLGMRYKILSKYDIKLKTMKENISNWQNIHKILKYYMKNMYLHYK